VPRIAQFSIERLMDNPDSGNKKAGWELFPHDADIGVRGFGPTREAAFEQAALALTGAITDVSAVAARQEVRVDCAAPSEDLLLVEWLNALVYEMATRGMLFSRFQVTIEGSRLQGRAWGEAVDVVRHEPATEVKGATYTALKVVRSPSGTWLAECIVDV
jgi:tRNA nucleotidyltransferase (CCA-adding enzyme)